MATWSFETSVPDDVLVRAKKIKLFLMDVDGTLTDGSVSLISTLRAEPGVEAVVTEMKTFSAQDGQGLSLAHTMGIKTGFITGRRSPAVTQRAKEMHVDYVCLGQGNKTAAFEDCMRQAGVTEEETAYLGMICRISSWRSGLGWGSVLRMEFRS